MHQLYCISNPWPHNIFSWKKNASSGLQFTPVLLVSLGPLATASSFPTNYIYIECFLNMTIQLINFPWKHKFYYSPHAWSLLRWLHFLTTCNDIWKLLHWRTMMTNLLAGHRTTARVQFVRSSCDTGLHIFWLVSYSFVSMSKLENGVLSKAAWLCPTGLATDVCRTFSSSPKALYSLQFDSQSHVCGLKKKKG